MEPYVGTGIIYPENYPSIKGYEECVQLLLKSSNYDIRKNLRFVY